MLQDLHVCIQVRPAQSIYNWLQVSSDCAPHIRSSDIECNSAGVGVHTGKFNWSMRCCCTLLDSGMRHIRSCSCTSKPLDRLMGKRLTRPWPDSLACCMRRPLGDSCVRPAWCLLKCSACFCIQWHGLNLCPAVILLSKVCCCFPVLMMECCVRMNSG